VTRPWVRRGIYGLRSAGSPGRVGGQGNGSGGSNGGGGSASTTPAMSVITEYTQPEHKATAGAMVPSWRLAEETQKKREALAQVAELQAQFQAEVRELRQRVEELETALRSSRNEWQFRRGKRAS
jgi:hypothetical protein